MASPIVSPEMRMVKRSGECLGVLIEEGLDGEDLQVPISDVRFRQELMRFWKSRGRSVESITRTPSQQRAADILGRNYHGPDQVAKHFGARYREDQLAHLAEIPFSEGVLTACKDTHILVAGYPLSILEIKKRMKKHFYNQDWYHKEDFARKTRVRLQWHLLRKTEVPNSLSKTYEEQKALLELHEEPSFACEMVFGMNLHFAETGERLHETSYVRCQDLAADGYRVYVGNFDREGLHVDNFWDGTRLDYLGLSSARKSPH